MTLVLKDRVKDTTTTTGTGTLTLAGAPAAGFRGFSEIGDGADTFYCIDDGTNWEARLGTVGGGGTTLTRGTLLASSTGSAISFSAGTKTVFCGMPAELAAAQVGGTAPSPALPNQTWFNPDTREFAVYADVGAGLEWFVVAKGYLLDGMNIVIGQIESPGLDGGGVTIYGGATSLDAGFGGNVMLHGGEASGDATGGYGGSVILIAGASDGPGGTGGTARINSGSGGAVGGDIVLEIGIGPTPGNLLVYNLPTAQPAAAEGLWNKNGVICQGVATLGDVAGPASSVDNTVPRFDGTGGKTLQVSALSVGDDGAVRSATNSGANVVSIGLLNYCMLVSDYTLTSSTSEQKAFNTTTAGRLTLPTGVYDFECWLYLTGMSATNGNYSFDPVGAGTAVTDRWGQYAFGIDNTTPLAVGATGGSASVTQQMPASVVTAGTGTGAAVLHKGRFRITTGGTIIPSVTLVTASAAVVKAGSSFTITKIGESSETTVGAWN